MKHLQIAVIAAVSVLASSAGVAQGPQAGFTVKVQNNTAGGTTVAGDEVMLHLHKGQQQVESRSAKAGEDGTIVFEDVPTGPATVAVARARHQNMLFRSPPVPLDSTAAEFSATVQVFDVSTDASRLSVGVHHLMVALRGTSLEFTEYMQLANSSDTAVTGRERDDQDRPVVLRVMLPGGFKNLAASSYLEREALVVTGDGFYDTMAVPPGEHGVAFSYTVDIGRGTTEILKEITLPTSQLMVLWEHGQGTLDGLGEPDSRLVNADGVPIECYRRGNLAPGDRLAFRIAGLDAKGSDRSTWILLAVVFTAILIVALLRLRSRPTSLGQQHA